MTVSVDGSRSESSGFRDDREHAAGAASGLAPRRHVRRPRHARRRHGEAAPSARTPSTAPATRTSRSGPGRGASASRPTSPLGGGWSLAPSASVRSSPRRLRPREDEPRPSTGTSTTRTGRRSASSPAGPSSAGRSPSGPRRAATRSTPRTSATTARSRRAAFVELGRPFSTASPSAGGFRAGLRADHYDGFGDARLAAARGLGRPRERACGPAASVGTAFRVPTFTELYYVDPQTIGNADLRPEKATNVEAGLTWDAGPVSLDAAVFYRHGTDLIDFVRSSPDRALPGRRTSGRSTRAASRGPSPSTRPASRRRR